MAKGGGRTRGNRPTNSYATRGRRTPTFGTGAGLGRSSGLNEPRALPRPVRPMNTTPIYERGYRYTPPTRSYGSARNIEPLKNIKDPAVYREIKHTISRFTSKFGLPERNIKLADLSPGTNGMQVSIGRDKNLRSVAIYLNKSVFNKSLKELKKSMQSGMDVGWHAKTNKPATRTIAHELGHALWEWAKGKGPARTEIVKLRNKLGKDPNYEALGYGRYGKKNTNEFWAELVAKTLQGKQDEYTREATRIIKTYLMK